MDRLFLVVKLLSFSLCADVLVAADLNVWPLPQHVSEASGNSVTVSPSLGFYTNSKSEILKSGILRYQEIIQESLSRAAENNGQSDEPMLLGVNLKTASDDETLNADTSYKYSLLYKGGKALQITADSPYGALYGLETLSQLIDKDQLVNSNVDITDYPTYKHRGLMLDTGRRFCPIEFIHNLLDAMSYVKFNVFHWHFADFCRFSIESEEYPNLRNGESQFYTQDDVAGIIQYAKERGIRVVPEVEIAMHAHGMRGLNGQGLYFCSSKLWQLYNDPNNVTLKTMKGLLGEMSKLFPDKLFHLGCDETMNVGPCNVQNTKALERDIFQHMRELGKTPFVWEEALRSTHAAINGTVIQVWRDAHVKDIVQKGFQCIDSSNANFYLDKPDRPASVFWANIANGVPTESKSMVLGGEVAMWTDFYCFIQQCVTPSKKPVAYWMFDEKYDAEFALSVSGVIWPRAIIGAGSFWNYQPSLDPQSSEFQRLYFSANQRLQKRGIITCPNECECTNVERCGQPIRQGLTRSRV